VRLDLLDVNQLVHRVVFRSVGCGGGGTEL
jgi:hypothetical protein